MTLLNHLFGSKVHNGNSSQRSLHLTVDDFEGEKELLLFVTFLVILFTLYPQESRSMIELVIFVAQTKIPSSCYLLQGSFFYHKFYKAMGLMG